LSNVASEKECRSEERQVGAAVGTLGWEGCSKTRETLAPYPAFSMLIPVYQVDDGLMEHADSTQEVAFTAEGKDLYVGFGSA